MTRSSSRPRLLHTSIARTVRRRRAGLPPWLVAAATILFVTGLALAGLSTP